MATLAALTPRVIGVMSIGPVSALAVRSQQVVAATAHGVFESYNCHTGEKARWCGNPNLRHLAMAGRVVLEYRPDQVIAWDTRKGECLRAIRMPKQGPVVKSVFHPLTPDELAFFAEIKHVRAGNRDYVLGHWHSAISTCASWFGSVSRGVGSTFFGALPQYILGSHNTEVVRWDLNKDEVVGHNLHEGSVSAGALHEHYFVTGDVFGKVVLCGDENTTTTFRMGGPVTALAVDQNIVAVGQPNQVLLLEANFPPGTA
ncbi:MAG: hypothetical protein H7A36_01625 [Chlamydiales bacterium]|nr:hypothetical protein [Chlamydiales bacterium]